MGITFEIELKPNQKYWINLLPLNLFISLIQAMGMINYSITAKNEG